VIGVCPRAEIAASIQNMNRQTGDLAFAVPVVATAARSAIRSPSESPSSIFFTPQPDALTKLKASYT